MSELKNVLGITAVILVFVGYIPYYRDIVRGKTKPHIYSWFLWAFVTIIVFSLQITYHAGFGALVTIAAAIMCIGIIILSLVTHKEKMDITFSDTLFLILAFVSLGLWLFAKQAVLAALLATTTDLLGFVPTIRKSWHKPYSETLSFYILNTFRFGLATFALQQYSLITALYPITWSLANGLFAVMLVFRRRTV